MRSISKGASKSVMIKSKNLIHSHKFIVFCGEHYNPLGMIRSLGEADIHPDLIVVKDGGRSLSSKSKYASKVFFAKTISEGYEILLREYIGNPNVDMPFVMTADDKITSYLDKNYEQLVGRAYFFNGGSAGRLTEYMNKEAILKIAAQHGLNVLGTVVVDKDEIPEGLSYPVITKAITPTEGAWKDDMHICNSEAELVAAFERIASNRVLIQKYIVKKNELCMEGMSADHGKDVLISIASTYNYYLPKSYSPYMTVGNLEDHELEAKIDSLLEDIGFEGIFEIEFLIAEDDTLYFSEINFRNSTWSYASTCAGMPLPVIWASVMLGSGKASDYFRKVPRGFTAIVEPDDFRLRKLAKYGGTLSWLKDLIRADCRFYLGRKGDLRPVLSFFLKR